jgi:hypothetical protein
LAFYNGHTVKIFATKVTLFLGSLLIEKSNPTNNLAIEARTNLLDAAKTMPFATVGDK